MKFKSFVYALLWGLLIILFPVVSGVMSAVFALSTVETLFLQSGFMLLGLVPPLIMLIRKRWRTEEIGLAPLDRADCKKALYFLPFILLYIPAATNGFTVKSAGYFFGCLCLYFSVGLAEEIYFRGIVPMFLGRAFSKKGIVILSSLIFGIGHLATAFSGGGTAEIILTVINALIFGFMAIELTMLVKSIFPAVIIHFLFDFETKFTAIGGGELLTAEIVRGTVMTALDIWLWAVFCKSSAENNAVERTDETE